MNSLNTATPLRRHPSFVSSAAVGGLLLCFAVVTSRPDLFVIALPVSLWAARAYTSDTHVPASAEGLIRCQFDLLHPKQAYATGLITWQVPHTADAVLVTITTERGKIEPILTTAERASSIAVRPPITHNGAHRLLSVTARAFTTLLWDMELSIPPVETTVFVPPPIVPLHRLALPGRLAPRSGAHPSPRQGEDGEYRDVHPFTPGTPLRRIDWKATARLARRPDDLYIRRTDTVNDTSAEIVLDTCDELGAYVATWGSGDLSRSGKTSMDVAREAASSLATAYIDAGDRVGLINLSLGSHQCTTGSGARHGERLRHVISHTASSGVERTVRRVPRVEAGALIFLCSTFFDPQTAARALAWRRDGHRVIAIDTLPQLDSAGLSQNQRRAASVLHLERNTTRALLRRGGVETLRWEAGTNTAPLTVRMAALGSPRRRR